jgi:hypothetical protein
MTKSVEDIPILRGYLKDAVRISKHYRASQQMSEPRSQRVRRYIAEVEVALQTQTAAQVSANFADFQKEFPKIFEVVLTRTYPRDIMAILLDNLDRMERGSRSQHDASVAVGTVLVDRIVKPQLEKK